MPTPAADDAPQDPTPAIPVDAAQERRDRIAAALTPPGGRKPRPAKPLLAMLPPDALKRIEPGKR